MIITPRKKFKNKTDFIRYVAYILCIIIFSADKRFSHDVEGYAINEIWNCGNIKNGFLCIMCNLRKALQNKNIYSADVGYYP